MKLTLGRKIGLGFAAVLALMVISAVLGYVKANDLKKARTGSSTCVSPRSLP